MAFGDSRVDFARVRSAFAIALHMHQPLIPAGGGDLRTAAIISNLQAMMESASDEQRYNAGVLRWCYERMGEFVPQLVREGKQPKVMLDYSGTLLWGFQQMGLGDVLEKLRVVTCDPQYRGCVEWLGSTWGHPVAPSTPVQDYRLHVRAWQQHFASLFGAEALGRVRGFSPAEMALPNHPDVHTHSSRPCETAAIGGSSFRSIRSSSREAAGLPSGSICPTASCAAIPGRTRGDHRHSQDAGQRHQARGANAAFIMRREGSRPNTSWARRSCLWSPRSRTARMAG